MFVQVFIERGKCLNYGQGHVKFFRDKSINRSNENVGDESLNVFKYLPGGCPLFPYLSRVRACDRVTEFKQRCRQLKIEGVTLHSYRYVWAERAKTAGYPERFAGSSRAQLESRASRLRETRVDEDPVPGRARATHRESDDRSALASAGGVRRRGLHRPCVRCLDALLDDADGLVQPLRVAAEPVELDRGKLISRRTVPA